MNLTIPVEIPDHRICDLLCCAIEGGSNYWYMITGHKKPSVIKSFSSFPAETEPVIFPHLDYPLSEDGGIYITDDETGEGVLKEPFLLDRKAIERGLTLMAQLFPKHWANFMSENEDADTGDCFLQCCCFPEEIKKTKELVFG